MLESSKKKKKKKFSILHTNIWLRNANFELLLTKFKTSVNYLNKKKH